jgi:hypothetical protein
MNPAGFEGMEPDDIREMGDLAGNPNAMDDEALEAALSSEITSAADFMESDLAPARIEALRFYRAEPFGDEEDGRSQVVMPVVRDTIRATLPGLMKVFFGGRRVMQFEPSSRMSTQQAFDATEAVNYVITRQNPGFRILHDAFKDALRGRSGWLKWYYDESFEVSAKTYSGITPEELETMESAADASEQIDVLETVLDTVIDEATGQPADVQTYRVQVTTRKPKNRYVVEAVPPDEVRYNREARCVRDARFIDHCRLITRSDLVAMGYDRDEIDEIPAASFDGIARSEAIARQPSQMFGMRAGVGNVTKDQELVEYHECYWRIDADGDGISELRKICAVAGKTRLEILKNEIFDEAPFAYLTPDIEPHVLEGLAQSDSTKDLQNIESHVMRDVLDSLKASIFPRFGVVENQANIDDVLNTEIGGAIRMRAPGAVTPFEVPFSGEKAFPLFEKLDQVKESRTGVGRAAMGLDGKALQSTTPDAARQSMTASQSQVELIARIFAETGLSDLYRGVYKLLVRHGASEMWVRKLNGRPLTVNPKDWDPELEVSVDSALGTGMNDTKIAVLSGVAAAQKEVLMQLGADNPLCSLQEFYHSNVDILELSGFRDIDRYWRSPEIAMQNGIELQEPPPSPEQVLAKAQLEIEKGKAHVEALKAILEDDRKRDELEADIILRATEIRAKYDADVDVASIQALIQRDRAQADESRDMAKAALKGEAQPVFNVHLPGQTPMRRVPVRDADGKVVEVREEPA